MSFLARLLLLVLIAVSPLVAVEVYTALVLQSEREARIEGDALEAALSIATEVEQVAESVKHMLIAASLAPPVRGDDVEACNRYLRDVKLRFAPELIVAVLGMDGRVKCRSELGPLPTVDNSDRYYFREALRTREFTIAEYTFGRVTGQHAIHMSFPVLSENGEAAGVIVVPVNVDWLSKRVARRTLPPNSSLTLADRNGTVLLRLPERDWVGKPLPEGIKSRMEGKDPRTFENLRVFDQVRRIVGVVPLDAEPRGISVAVALSHDVAIAPIRSALERSAFLIVLAVTAALFAAWAIGRYTLQRPVAVLDRAARSWIEGSYEARTGLKGRGELERLGQTFDHMADALQKRELERARSEDDLRRSRDEALQASTSKTNFLAAASHDLRQPLQSMSMTVAVLEHRHRNDDDTPIVERLGRAIRNLSELLNTLLDISRLEAGLVKPEIATFDLATLMRDIRDDFGAAAASRGLRLELEACEAHVSSDPNLLGRILRNLTDNALKFTPAGGTVRLSCSQLDGEVEVQVADTGVGIAPDQQSEIFREFQQLNNPARDPSKGLGLGLAIVDRMSRMLGHRLGLSSTPGKGSTFTLYVPLAQDDAPAGPERSGELRVRGRVLLVEDNEDVLSSTGALLSALGAEVTTAVNASEALRRMDEATFDAVLADYRLPDRSGLEVLKHARERWPGVTAVLVTGDPEVEKLASQAAGVRVVQKPLTAERLAGLFV